MVTLAAALSLAQLASVHDLSLDGRNARLGTHFIFGILALLPGLHRWHLDAREQPTKLLEAFWTLVGVNDVGGSIYAIHLQEKAIGMELGMRDVSHHVMHAMVLAGACEYERGLLSVYQARAANALELCA